MNYVILILFCHFVADFIYQTDEMAKNKSKSLYWLSEHILAYSLVMFNILLPVLILCGESVKNIIIFVLLNAVLHFITDYFTSKESSKLYAKGDVHNFFVVIGIDGFIHQITLILTYNYIFN